MADTMNSDTIRKILLRRYLIMLTPAAFLFGVWAALRQAGVVHPMDPQYTGVIGPAIFIAAIILAVALPLLYRIQFVRTVKGSQSVDPDLFLPFQQGLMSLALLASYTAAAGYMAGVSTFHFSGAFLASLYGAYYYFPSGRRVAQEMRLFRVNRDNGDD